jgi:2-furoyl-CoA dehydrogenase FAD binding subunit
MKPARFDYVRPDTVAEVLSLLAEEGDLASILAGGQSLLPMLSMRLARTSLLVDIAHVPELRQIRRKDNAILVGASVTQAAMLLNDGLKQDLPLLAKALPWVGHEQTRSRGTVCGSIAHADPSAELPLCLCALGGEIHLAARKRRRKVSAADFFAGMMTTDRADDEFIEAVAFPVARKGAGYGFREFGRRHGDFAIVAVATMATAASVTIAVGGVNDTPTLREWARLDGRDLDDALNALAWELDARDDLHASARLRRDLVRSLGREAIEEALQCIA